MARLEDRVSELLHSATPPLPGVEPEDVTRQVRRRRTVAWSAAAVAAVAAVVVGVAFFGTSDAGPAPGPVVNHSLRGAVPWIDQPASPYEPPPTPRPAKPATDARPCTASDVAARFLPRGDGATGHMLIQMRFRNISSSTCVLRGYPTQVVASQPGLPDVTAQQRSYFPNQPTANLAPDRTAFLGLETDSMCAVRPAGGPAGPPYHHVSVSVPGGGTVAVTRHSQPLDLTCGLRMTKFFVPQPTQPEPHDPLGDLRASARLPRTVRAGTTLKYGVALTNPTSKPISLDRCPGYVEAVGDSSGLTVKLTYALNCTPVGAVAPGDTVLFEMRIPAPKQPGRYRLHWELMVPSLDGPRGFGSIQVVP